MSISRSGLRLGRFEVRELSLQADDTVDKSKLPEVTVDVFMVSIVFGFLLHQFNAHPHILTNTVFVPRHRSDDSFAPQAT
jgi:hypothetical protein